MLDEFFQMVQSQHKATASVLRLAKATRQESALPTYQVMKESVKARAIIVAFYSGRRPYIHCRITFKLDLFIGLLFFNLPPFLDSIVITVHALRKRDHIS